MSIGVRVMFVGGDRIIRVPLRRFDRLFDRNFNEAMPEYAGQRVRCAMVYVSTNGNPRRTKSAHWWTWRLSTESWLFLFGPVGGPREKCLAVRVAS